MCLRRPSECKSTTGQQQVGSCVCAAHECVRVCVCVYRWKERKKERKKELVDGWHTQVPVYTSVCVHTNSGQTASQPANQPKGRQVRKSIYTPERERRVVPQAKPARRAANLNSYVRVRVRVRGRTKLHTYGRYTHLRTHTSASQRSTFNQSFSRPSVHFAGTQTDAQAHTQRHTQIHTVVCAVSPPPSLSLSVFLSLCLSLCVSVKSSQSAGHLLRRMSAVTPPSTHRTSGSMDGGTDVCASLYRTHRQAGRQAGAIRSLPLSFPPSLSLPPPFS
mmetsp:Transcript_4330/g.11414  ORF Transcript_4330/g.11414 Transcript_4330/m.11414 type:complete len:276 (-) Transcript_4330:1873-2700(-)